MKKIALVAVAALIVLVSSGCTPADPVAGPSTSTVATPSETPTPTPTPTPTIDPGPVVLTTEAAAGRYLDLICARNIAALAVSDGFTGWEATYMNGGSPNLDEVRAAAAAAMDAAYNAVVLMDDPYYVWPETVQAHLASVRSGNLENVTSYDAVKNASSYDQARSVIFPDQTASASAAQEIRLALGIPPDTTASCVGHENGQATLLAEKAEREAALAEQ